MVIEDGEEPKNPASKKRKFEELLHVPAGSTVKLELIKHALNIMDDFFNKQQALVRELQATGTIRRNSSKLSKPSCLPSQGRWNSRQSSKFQNQLSCAHCYGDHYVIVPYTFTLLNVVIVLLGVIVASDASLELIFTSYTNYF